MTTSAIIQTIVVLGIVALALVYVLRRVTRTMGGKKDCGCNCDCGCGCGKQCKNKPTRNY